MTNPGEFFDLIQYFSDYEKYKEITITTKRIFYADVINLSEKINSSKLFCKKILGHSVENREINMLSFGNGPVNILCWSQMHGNESTATMAFFDIFNFLISQDSAEYNHLLSENLTLHFIPMLNPDGAERFIRENALNIDLNRDAIKLASPESKILKQAIDDLKPLFGFNLHDQKIYYSAGYSSNPATISFLAPAYNFEKDINSVRKRSMQLIGQLNQMLQNFIPNSVAKYDDEFEPRAFGDNIMKWNTSTVLIESGGYKNDEEKQYLRKLNYISLLFSFFSIATSSYEKCELDYYNSIPENRERLFDLKIKNLTYIKNDQKYKIDIGINRNESYIDDSSQIIYSGVIEDIGDLSTFSGYEEFDGTGFQIIESKIFVNNSSNKSEIELIREGYLHLKKDKPTERTDSKINTFDKNPPNTVIELEAPANFYLENKNGDKIYAVINGFLVNLENNSFVIPNCIHSL